MTSAGIAIIIPTSLVKHAVARNRMRRQIREAIRRGAWVQKAGTVRIRVTKELVVRLQRSGILDQ